MDKHAVAMVLEEIATLLDLHGEVSFKSKAYSQAARAIEKIEGDVVTLNKAGELQSIAGIGPATAKVIKELIETGTSKYYQDLRKKTPSGFYELLAVPKLGPKKIRLLHEQLGVETIADLEKAAREGKVSKVKGFSARSEEILLQGITYVRGTLGRRRLAEALDVGPRLLGFVESVEGVIAAELVGELRRKCETVDGIRIVACAKQKDIDDVLQAFIDLPGITGAIKTDANTATARLSDGFTLQLKCVAPDAFGEAVIRETGSSAHVEKLGDISGNDEAEIYERLGLQFVYPELREDGSEVDVAREGELPELVDVEDLRGCFHCHTVYSDGRATVAEMAEAAHERGWRYLGIADHSKFASYAGGLLREDIERQHDEIDAWNEEHGAKVWLFKGIEADILSDGRLDYEDEEGLLETFDYVIGSIHSSFALDEVKQTTRLIRAMQNPELTFIGHMTGRLLLSRAGYKVDIDAVFEAAVLTDSGIEINADPHRLDLGWQHWRKAKALGIKTAINPDAHSTRSLGVVEYGVCMARKGWLEPADVVNTWKLPAVKKWLRRRS